MRISDWSSDVCSSDLAASANPAELSDMHKPSGPVRSRNSVEIAIKGKKPEPGRTRAGPFAVHCWRRGFPHSGCFIQPLRTHRLSSEPQLPGPPRAYATPPQHEIPTAHPSTIAPHPP